MPRKLYKKLPSRLKKEGSPYKAKKLKKKDYDKLPEKGQPGKKTIVSKRLPKKLKKSQSPYRSVPVKKKVAKTPSGVIPAAPGMKKKVDPARKTIEEFNKFMGRGPKRGGRMRPVGRAAVGAAVIGMAADYIRRMKPKQGLPKEINREGYTEPWKKKVSPPMGPPGSGVLMPKKKASSVRKKKVVRKKRKIVKKSMKKSSKKVLKKKTGYSADRLLRMTTKKVYEQRTGKNFNPATAKGSDEVRFGRIAREVEGAARKQKIPYEKGVERRKIKPIPRADKFGEKKWISTAGPPEGFVTEHANLRWYRKTGKKYNPKTATAKEKAAYKKLTDTLRYNMEKAGIGSKMYKGGK